MPLSLPAGFAAAVTQPKTVDLCFLVNIYSAQNVLHQLTDKPSQVAAAQVAVARVTPMQRSVDVITRRTAVGSCDIELHLDPYISGLIVNKPLFGTSIEIKLGTTSVAEAVFAPYFAGIIAEILPTENMVLIRCKTFDDELKAVAEPRAFGAKNPLEVIEDYLADIIPSTQYSATTLDPDNTVNVEHADIGHFVVSRGQFETSNLLVGSAMPSNARVAIDELCQMLQGSLYADEDGILRFRIFSRLNTSSDDWVDEDMDECRLVSQFGHVYNRVAVRCFDLPEDPLSKGGRGEVKQLTVRYSDSAAQGRFQFFTASAATDQVRELTLENTWVRGATTHFYSTSAASGLRSFGAGVSPSAGQTMSIGPNAFAFCGTRWVGYPAGSQDNWSKLSAINLLYLQINNEIIACDGTTLTTGQRSRVYFKAPSPTDYGGGDWFASQEVPSRVVVDISERDALGSPSESHILVEGQTPIYDVTIPIYTAKILRDRCSNGLPVVKVTTSLAKYDIQLGNLVTMTTDRLTFLDHDGVTTTTLWEVTKKEIDPYASPPRISWELTYASDSGSPSVVDAYDSVTVFPADGTGARNTMASTKDVDQEYVATGFAQSSSGLDVTITAGRVGGPRGVKYLYSDTTDTLGAEVDTYVTFSAALLALIYHPVEVGAGIPDEIGADEILLWLFTTDQTDVVFWSDLRPDQPLNGDKLVHNSAGSAQLITLDEQGLVPNATFGIRTGDSDTVPPDSWATAREATASDPEGFQPLSFVTDTGSFATDAAPVITPAVAPTASSGAMLLSFSIATINADITSITQTNVLWTEVLQETGTARRHFLWHGNKTGGTPGTTITVNIDEVSSGAWVYSEVDNLGNVGGSFPVTNTDKAENALAHVTGSVATSTAKELMVASFGRSGGGASDGVGTPLNGFTTLGTSKGTVGVDSGKQTAFLGYKLVNAGTYAWQDGVPLTGGASGGNKWCAGIALLPLISDAYPEDLMLDPDLWGTGADQLTEEASVTRTQNVSIRVRGDTQDKKLLLQSDLTPAEPARIYTIQLAFQRTHADMDPVADIVWLNSAQTIIGVDQVLTTPSGTGTWIVDTKVAESPANTAYMQIYVGGERIASAGTPPLYLYVDRVKVDFGLDAFRAYDNSGTSVNTSTWTRVDVDTVVTQHASNFDATTNYQYVAPQNGDYSFSGRVEFPSIAASKTMQCAIYVDGAAIAYSAVAVNDSAGTRDISATVNAPAVGLAAAGTVELWAWHDDGGSLTTNTGILVTNIHGKQIQEF